VALCARQYACQRAVLKVIFHLNCAEKAEGFNEIHTTGGDELTYTLYPATGFTFAMKGEDIRRFSVATRLVSSATKPVKGQRTGYSLR